MNSVVEGYPAPEGRKPGSLPVLLPLTSLWDFGEFISTQSTASSEICKVITLGIPKNVRLDKIVSLRLRTQGPNNGNSNSNNANNNIKRETYYNFYNLKKTTSVSCDTQTMVNGGGQHR